MEEPACPDRVVMSRTFLFSLAIVGLAVGVPHARQQPEFRASTTTVSVHATVVDSEGRVVTGLSREDFEVFDNGRLQPVKVFDAGQRPISIVMMIDRSTSMAPHAARVDAAARAFVSNLLPDDRVRIGSFADQIRIEPDRFTGDAATLHRIIDRSPAGGATPLWRATSMALNALEDEEGQRVVLVFTDGRDTPAFSARLTFRDILTRVRQEETMVYAVGLAFKCGGTGGARRGPPPGFDQAGPLALQRLPGRRFPGPTTQMPFPGGRGRTPFPIPQPRRAPIENCRETGPDPDLQELAIAGGGGYVELRSTDDLTTTFEQVARELHSQYLLGFDAPELDGRLHDLDVRVKRAAVTVRARRTYLAAAE
jgi:VWFA-related protein